MVIITKTDKNSLLHFLTSFISEELRFQFGQTFEHAYQYAFDSNVKEIELVNENFIKAKVDDYRLYEVTLQYDKNGVFSECTCLSNDVCLHSLALLICVNRDELIIQSLKKDMEFDTEAYLKTLNKNELIQLILKEQTTDFQRMLRNKTMSENEMQETVQKAHLKLEAIFHTLDWETDIQWIDQKLTELFKTFRGGWTLAVDEISELFEKTFKMISDAIEEGYLYNHYYDESFNGDSLIPVLHEFISEIPVPIKFDHMKKIESAIAQKILLWNEYSIENDLFSDQDKTQLPFYLIKGEIPAEYVKISFSKAKMKMNTEEKKAVLENYWKTDQSLLLEYAEQFVEKNKFIEAEYLFQNYFESHEEMIEGVVLKKWIELKVLIKQPIHKFLDYLLRTHPNKENLSFIKMISPQKLPACEQILKQYNFNEYILFLEKENRLNEAEKYISTQQSNYNDEFHFQFYCRHGREFYAQSTKFFVKRIERNLEHAGDSYYFKIANTLLELSKINPSQSRDLLDEIQLKYRRRPKLMSILKGL